VGDVTGLQAALDGKQAAGSYATAAQGALAETAVQPAAIAGLSGPQVFVQEAEPMGAGPLMWWQTDAGGNLLNLTLKW
jgi:hypothetical protein